MRRTWKLDFSKLNAKHCLGIATLMLIAGCPGTSARVERFLTQVPTSGSIQDSILEHPEEVLPAVEVGGTESGSLKDSDSTRHTDSKDLYVFDTTTGLCLNSKMEIGLNTISGDEPIQCGDYRNKTLNALHFKDCDLSGSNFTDAKFINSKIEACLLKNVVFLNTTILDSDFSGSVIENSDLEVANISNSQIPTTKESIIANSDIAKSTILESTELTEPTKIAENKEISQTPETPVESSVIHEVQSIDDESRDLIANISEIQNSENSELESANSEINILDEIHKSQMKILAEQEDAKVALEDLLIIRLEYHAESEKLQESSHEGEVILGKISKNRENIAVVNTTRKVLKKELSQLSNDDQKNEVRIKLARLNDQEIELLEEFKLQKKSLNDLKSKRDIQVAKLRELKNKVSQKMAVFNAKIEEIKELKKQEIKNKARIVTRN